MSQRSALILAVLSSLAAVIAWWGAWEGYSSWWLLLVFVIPAGVFMGIYDAGNRK